MSEKATKKEGIEGIAGLQKEFTSGKMPERKRVALREALIRLYKAKTCPKKEEEVLFQILKSERHKRKISSNDETLLANHEAGKLETTAIVKSSDTPPVLFMRKESICKYEYDPDMEKYVVYVPITVAPEEQLTMSVRRKMDAGHPVKEDELKPEYVYYRRNILNPKEFALWLEPQEEVDLTALDEPKAEEYSF